MILRYILLRGLTGHTVIQCSECEWVCMAVYVTYMFSVHTCGRVESVNVTYKLEPE